MSDRRRRVVIALVVIAAVAIAATTDLRGLLAAAPEQLRAAGPTGKLLFAAAYVVATVLFLPASALTLAAGFAWGPVQGFFVVWPAATVGATAAFVLGRTALRDVVAARTAADPRFAAIERAVAEQGWQLVLLLRLSPLFPFNLLNYALGLTSVSLRDYALATAFGILPGTLMFVWAGSTVSDLSRALDGGADVGEAGVWAWRAGLVATVAVSVLAARIARRALDGRLGEPPT